MIIYYWTMSWRRRSWGATTVQYQNQSRWTATTPLLLQQLPQQPLAVDVFETENELVIKARTAGVDRNDLDVSISDGILTISGTLSSGDEGDVRNWHIQECYWGEFSRTLPLPTAVNEEGVKAELKDGVLTITFEKIKQERAKKIKVL